MKITGKLGFIVKRFFIALFAFYFAFQPSVVFAFDANFYSSNDVLFFNPDASSTCSISSAAATASNVDYAGNQILNSAQLSLLQENTSFYKKSAEAENFPWQILAAIHLREYGLKREGPANGDGPYQILGSEYPAGQMTNEDFQAATDTAAAFIRNKMGDADLTVADNVKRTFFLYNGAASVYKTQAKALGFSDAEANNGEGSPYVMNKADRKRDPSANPSNTWGQIKQDSGSISYPANNDYGAYVVYASLAGIELGGGCNNGGIISGGMTLEQAQAFAETYTNSSDSVDYIGGASTGCAGGALSNCVSFSAYFVNKYTSLDVLRKGLRTGNGNEVVGNMSLRNSSIEVGSIPRPYSVFSRYNFGGQYQSAGHTGVVVGVDIENDKMIIVEASCSSSRKGAVATEYTMSRELGRYENLAGGAGAYKFAYTEPFLNDNLLTGGTE